MAPVKGPSVLHLVRDRWLGHVVMIVVVVMVMNVPVHLGLFHSLLHWFVLHHRLVLSDYRVSTAIVATAAKTQESLFNLSLLRGDLRGAKRFGLTAWPKAVLMARHSDLELDADLHDLSAGNLEIRARPLGVVVHERE
jgi:hypothetical protein